MKSMRRSADKDSGSILILALILITVIGSLLLVVSSFTGTGLLVAQRAATQRSTANDVDGAVQGAINSIRGSALPGTLAYGTACGPFTYAAPGRSTVIVDCAPRVGILGTGDSPSNAILTVGANASDCRPAHLGEGDGLCVDGNHVLTVDGNVYSHSNITVGGSSGTAMQVFGDVYAETGTCPNVTTTSGLPHCPGSDPSGDDPALTLPTVPSAIDPTGTCTSRNSVVHFSPGIYTEIPQPASNCQGDVWWFGPPVSGGLGVYYFDFPDAGSLWQLNALPGDKIIAGAHSATWDESTSSSDAVFNDANFGKACVDDPANGAEFVFGGQSRIQVASTASLAICAAAPSSGAQRVALYGVKSSVTPPVTTTIDSNPSSEATPAAIGDVGFQTDATGGTTLARTVDNLSAVATFVNTSNQAPNLGTVALSGFGGIPAGARISSATDALMLDVVHNESVGSSISSTVDVAVGTSIRTFPVPSCVGATACTSTVNITTALSREGGGYPQNYPYKDVQGMKVTYKATANLPNVNSGPVTWTANLDGVRLHVKQSAPGYRGTSCLTTCPLLQSSVNLNLYFRGTVYAPDNYLDLRVHNTDDTIFGRGVVARSIHVNISASSKQTDAPFQLPKSTTGREVLFTAKIGGVAYLRALVQYVDFDVSTGVPLAFPGRKVVIESWVVLRGT